MEITRRQTCKQLVTNKGDKVVQKRQISHSGSIIHNNGETEADVTNRIK